MEQQIHRHLSRLDHQFGTQAAQLPCEISQRFQNTLGQYCYQRETQKRSFRFSAKLQNNPELLRQVVIHEYIHYYLESQKNITGHGAAFRQLCRHLGIPPRATLENQQLQQTARYQIYCPSCEEILATRHRLTQKFCHRIKHSVCRRCQSRVVICDRQDIQKTLR